MDEYMQINDQFLELLNTEEGISKVAEASSTFIRLKMREDGFTRKIMPPEFITVGDLYRHEQRDEFYKLKDIEPDSTALAVTLRGRADYEYVNGKRYKITFFPLETERYEKKEDELLAYEMPITRLIEQNSVKDLQRVEDGRFIGHCDAAVASAGTTASSAYVVASGGNYIPKNVMTKLANVFTDNELELEYILMNKKDFASIYLWENLGSSLSHEVIPGGYKYETLNGIKIVVTNKSELVPAGSIYGFTHQSFFGDFFILSDVKFFIKKEFDMISFFAKENIGIGIGNTKGVAKLTLSGTL